MKKNIYKTLILCILTIFISTFVYANIKTFEEKNFISIETPNHKKNEPKINAKHAVILDRNSKTPIYKKSETEKCKMASTTKIMTAIIIIENCNLDDIVEISSKSAGTGGSRLGLIKKDRISVKHLLYGLMLKSGNDAAVALAEYTSGSIENFAVLMNKKAKEINLSNSNFVTPHGLDNENHYTTAYDLAILTDYALNNELFTKIVKSKGYTVLINNKPRTISNTNELLGNFEGIYGVKTGFTNGANRCLVTACKRGSLDFICIVLGCDTKKNRTQDSIKLLNYAFNNYSLLNIQEIAQKKFDDWILLHKNSFYINKGKNKELNIYLDTKSLPFLKIAVNKMEKDMINVEISFDTYFDAPLVKDAKVGELSIQINNNTSYSINILNQNTIDKKNIYDYLLIIFQNYSHFLYNK